MRLVATLEFCFITASGGGGPMLAPPVAQGAGGRPVGGAGGGGSGGLGTRGQPSVGPAAALWPLTPTQPSASPGGQTQGTPPLSTTPAPAHSQGVSRYGLYSLFPGSNPGGYVAATPAPSGPSPTRAYHATTHKVSESVFSAAVGVGVGVGGYTWGAPTPPPGSPYSPVPVTQLELLAKSLAPPAQQALSLQGVGVNVGSLHHAQHTQHTQHTLNLAGLHHLHHGGLHQSTFSPQLSLVTGSAPTLTINSFSSPNSTGNVVPTTGVLLQEYQSPISSNTSCPTSLSSSSGPTGVTTSTSAMLIQGTTYQGITKRREAFLPSQGQPIKLENKSRQPCVCRSTNGKTKIVHSDAGCSRTLPIVSSWNGQDITLNCNGSSTMNSATSLVKREPMTSVPCQVAEVSTSLHATTTAVKIEPVPPKSENGIVVSNSGGGIPVGIAVARQRLQHQETSSSTRNVSLSHHTSHHASYHHFQPDAMGGTAAMTVGGATLVHCGGPGEDRPSHLTIPSTSLPPGLNAALNSTLNSTLGSLGAAATQATTWPHTFWQYPTAAMPMDPVGFPQMGIGGLQGGLQLVRDPTTGHLLLIHAAEQVQQAVVWPNYPGNSGGNVGPPPLLLPPPPPPSLQLLSDIGGTRLVLTENKRKQQNNLPIVKIEADCSNSPTTIITSTESTKALQTVTSMSGALIPDSPLVTTLHYYPHAPALVQISQAEPAHCKSQATSPVSCLTPPPESTTIHAIEPPDVTPIGVQDASNQTDAPEVEEELPAVETIVKQEQNLSPCQLHSSSRNVTNFEIVSSPEKLCNIVRITNVNSSSVCNVVSKVEKTENTIAVTVSDSPRYSSSGNTAKECRSITSVDRTIEHVVNCHAQEERIPDVRSGPKIIEITEENCDSFHENLEFFTRRRDFVDERKEKASVVAQSFNQVQSKLETARIIEEPKVENVSPDLINNSQKMTEQQNCLNCCQSREAPENLKISFDMPTIDYEEQACEQVVVKQEKEEKFTDCLYSEKPLARTQPQLSEPAKRHSVEKFHPGIENVVEKLKKNAAAALQDIRKAEDEVSPDRNRVWKVENTFNEIKTNLNNNLKSEKENNHVGNTEEPENLASPVKKTAKRLENHSYNSPKKNYVFNNYILNNNIDEKPALKLDKTQILSPGNTERKSEALLPSAEIYSTKEKGYVSKITAVKNGGLFAGENVPAKQPPLSKANAKSNPLKQKPVVDLSGLELLSNSIEQFEHLKPDIQAGKLSGTETPTDFLKSPTKFKSCITPQSESNNNNVDSPLGLLCALAEQRFMEEVGGEEEPKKLASFDNSEEISQAGRLLLNLGKVNSDREEIRGEKRKYPNDDFENAKKLRRGDYDEAAVIDSPKSGFQPYEKSDTGKNVADKNEKWVEFKAKTRRQIVFSDKDDPGLNSTKEDSGRNDSAKNMKLLDLEEPKSREKTELHERCLKPVTNLKVENVRTHTEYKKKYEYHIRNCKEYFDESYRENEFTDSEAEHSANEADIYPASTDPKRTSLSENGSFVNLNASIEECRDSHHRYRSQQSEDEAKKFIARKGQADSEAEWPNMDAMELDMRVKLADIQRKYKEKQKELSKLTPKKDDKKGPGRPRKKSHSSSSECGGVFPSPPILEPVIQSPQKSPVRSPEVVPPPLTSGVVGMPRCNVNLVKLGEPRSHIKLLDSIPSIPIPVPPVASPITVLPTSTLLQDDDDKSVARLDYDTSSPAPTVTGLSSASKKRKVGRPRKLMCASGSIRHLTETIVAKKPKSKSSLVGYLLAAKNRHLQNKFVNKTGYTPLPLKSGITGSKANPKAHKNSKHLAKGKGKPVKQTPLHNKSVISSIIAEKEKFSTNAKLEKQASKVKPKLKAEAKLKTWEDDENGDWNNVAESIPLTDITPPASDPVEEVAVVPVDKEIEKHEKSKKKKRKSCSSSPKRRKSGDRDSKDSKRRKSTECKECKECAKVAKNDKTDNVVNRCKLTAAHLAIDQLRVLTAMGGLFYAGRLSAVQAPDVYAITLDGERGNRPHIHPREEILRDAIVEVCPSSTNEIPPGTRLCAYWSQQYRCLYPGTSVEPSEPDPELDEKFVSVEFDDGDSGRIALDDIRLLQPDYPVVEYDPNPLLTLGKRRRQTSLSTEEKRSSTGSQPPMVNAGNGSPDVKSSECSKTEDGDSKLSEDHRERKRMKKRRRNKLKRLQEQPLDGKKRHRKHKCCEEHRKHKHRKHRKHRHRHSHHSSHSSHSEASHHSGGESCSGQKSEEESASPLKEPVPEIETEEKEVEVEEPEPEVAKEDEVAVEEKQQEKTKKGEKKAKSRERQESVESRSKMAAFLPARQLWGWAGKGYRRPGAKGRAKKQFFKAIKRGSETIEIGDSAVFLSTGRPDRPYIGRIKSMWETTSSNMIVKVKWFYHPEETVGCPTNLKYPGALFESPHTDENDVQTISHKCEVLPLEQYVEKLSKEPHRFLTIYDNNDIYYLAGYYDPTTYLLNMQPGVV